MNGILHILGVGPGRRRLLTVRAAQVLEEIQHVFVPVSQKGRKSIAGEIVHRYINAQATVTEMEFPMTCDREELDRHYRQNVDCILDVLRSGHDAALVTLGDPATYSTSWPVVDILQYIAPEISIEIVPGVTSFALGAAQSRRSLAEGNQILSVVSAYDEISRIERIIDVSDTVVFLKTYRSRDRLVELLRGNGLIESCVYIQRCGLENEEIIRDLSQLPEEIDYLSMIILKKTADSAE